MSQDNSNDDEPVSSRTIAASAGRQGDSTIPRLKLSQLMSGGRELIIEHDGKDYRLRVTSRGRLILTR